ncbi:MAG: DUF58 domain-containing protein [Clostridia bacterium]|nr:DUF58 domain-containing protein [Clostridia bacterium]
MKIRMTMPSLVTFSLLAAAFSTGSPVFLTGAMLIILLCASSILGVRRAAGTLTVSSGLTDHIVQRGDDVQLEVALSYRGLIPIAPLQVEVSAGPDKPEQTIRLNAVPGRPQKLTLPFHAAHIGVSSPGVKAVTVTDLFGLCSARVVPETVGGELIVLPLPFDVGELTYAAGDSGSETMARASEDITSPAEVRAYQQGDAMKKIHWKLSMRKQELMVRRFEEPVMPDALVLMDCSKPPKQQHAEAELDVRDALLETAASVMQENTRTGHPAKLPLLGEHPIELDKGMGMPVILEALARADFSAGDKFERVLLLELRRMRKVGSTVVIAARLNSRMVDVMMSMRRMGPYVRFYLVTFTPDDAQLLPMITKLQSAGVEVCYVTPAAM